MHLEIYNEDTRNFLPIKIEERDSYSVGVKITDQDIKYGVGKNKLTRDIQQFKGECKENNWEYIGYTKEENLKLYTLYAKKLRR